MRGPMLIVWGRDYRVCLPSQARRAIARFPGARLQWSEAYGHVPRWDRPLETTRVLLASTS